MEGTAQARGQDLLEGGRTFGLGPRWLARLWAGSFDTLIARIDAGLERGSLEGVLPDGSVRRLGGRAPGFEAQVTLHSMRALARVATGGSVGLYQAWEAGEWESPDPVQFFALFMDNAATLGDVARAHGPWRLVGRAAHWLHRNTRAGSLRNIHAHYDLGNDFYEEWLGESMVYSSGIFGARSDRPMAEAQFLSELDLAQSAKVGEIALRLGLDSGDRVLEIGCGWGTAAAFLADTYDAQVDAISLSDEQLAWARRQWRPEQGAVDFRKQDYRDVSGQYDAIFSIEMVEAVGHAYWPDFFDCIARNLKPGGRAAIQYIAIRDDLFDAYARSADFIQTYIFPGGMLVRESEFERLAANRGLSWQDRVSFGQDYARTLAVWRENFDRAVREGRLPQGFDERFVRLWRFYLMYCEGGFRGGGIDVAQVTLVKDA
jgi:cyclopropane-fatty-acyl-phospholipid synthase